MSQARKLTVKQLKQRIQPLSPAERLELFRFISDLPDSGIETGNLVEPPFNIPPSDEKIKESETTDEFVLIYTTSDIDPKGVAVIFKGKTVLQVFFYPQNYHEGRLKMNRSWQYAEPTSAMIDRVRAAITDAGGTVSDEQILNASAEAMKKIFEAMSARMTNELAVRLPDMVGLLMKAGEKVIEISVLNGFSLNTGQFDKVRKLDQIVAELDPIWQRIKESHLGISHGGARNIKHIWTPEQQVCLKSNYERLKPIWIDAKRIASRVQASTSLNTARQWRQQVFSKYPDLPGDLLDRFEFLKSDDARPADLALLHAARTCIPASLSVRTLRSVLKKFSTVPKT